MQLLNLKKNSFTSRLNGLMSLVFLAGFISFGLSLLTPSAAYANCSQPLVPITDQCVEQNCRDAGFANDMAGCQQIIQECENTTKFAFQNASQVGNCSNAMRSCFQNQIDTTPCRNNGVLSTAASCNNGNVDADGDCGIDSAINSINIDSGGEDFKTNEGIKGDREKAMQEVCNVSGWTIQQIETCKNNARDDFDACYGELGGTAKKITDEQISNCMSGKADNPGDCSTRGGTWNAATNKCDPPKPQNDPNDQNNPANKPFQGGNPFGTNKGCGEAETVIVECERGDRGVTVLAEVVRFVIIALTIVVGIAAVGGIAWASVLYAKAEDNESNVKEAKELIRNVAIGILLYGFMIAIVNWLVPGGVIT